MERLSEVMALKWLSREYGMVIFGMVAKYCLEIDEDNQVLEGLCPERIAFSDDWNKTWVIKTKRPSTSYAYYPPEYLAGDSWDSACTVFALSAIAYRFLTGDYPYIGSEITDEVLSMKKEYVQQKRSECIVLDAKKVPPAYRDFLIKGLALNRWARYQNLDDAADDYSGLADKICLGESTTPSPQAQEPIPEGLKTMMLQHVSTEESILNVHTAEEGGRGLDDLAGLQELKECLRNGPLAILKAPEKAKRYKLSLPNGILLYGPPGCGKTTVAKAFAAECRMNYAIVRAQDVASTSYGGTPILVKKLFSEAEKHAPIVLILDECEVLFPDRSNPELIKIAENTNAFLSELCSAADRGVFIVATTNKPDRIDSAILRSGRMDKRIYVPLPDEETRVELFNIYLSGRPVKGKFDFQKLSNLTSAGYISSDIQQICEDAACRAFCSDSCITQELIEQIIQEGGPTVHPRELKSYEDSRQILEPRKYQRQNNHIGFR